jgi:hypothetical protein
LYPDLEGLHLLIEDGGRGLAALREEFREDDGALAMCGKVILTPPCDPEWSCENGFTAHG